MNVSPEAIAESYAACHRMSRHAGSNFPAAFLLLPRAKRRAMDALYAFMRHSDDLVDEPHCGCRPAEALLQWRKALEQSLSGVSHDAATDRPEESCPEQDDSTGRALLPALVHTIGAFRIPPEHLLTVLDGVEMDLARRRYQTFEQLTTYCERVASAVGMACIHIWGFDSGEAMGPARSAGLALQLTNILRDLKEDAQQDRVYLPLDDLEECGYSVADLRAGVVNASFRRLMEMEAGRAERLYEEGAQLLRWLHPDGRRIFGMMTATYHALLGEIRRRPGDVFARRIRLSWPKKLRIIARWAFVR